MNIYFKAVVFVDVQSVLFAFTALIRLVGQQERHLADKETEFGTLVVLPWLDICTFWSSGCHIATIGPLSLDATESKQVLLCYL